MIQVGAAEYRRLRKEGRTPLPGATLLPTASPFHIPSREPGRTIPCRALFPQNGYPARGLFLHLHGGGWVLNDEASSDVYLQSIADSCGLICLSVGYRLAPEHPHPAAPDDCFDAAAWLIANAPRCFGTDLAFIGGESAGAHLAVVATLALLKSEQHASFRLRGILLHYGTYTLRWQPSTKLFRKNPTLILDEEMLNHFRDAYVPSATEEQFTLPELSPFFADLNGLDLPPALFTAGTEDCLLDDSIFMSTRWMMAGRKAILKIYPGSPHGYILFPPSQHENTKRALGDTKTFVDMMYTASLESHVNGKTCLRNISTNL